MAILDTLPKNEAHLYKAHIDSVQTSYQDMFSSLSKAEKKRSNEFVHKEDREKFILARYMVRTMLYQYTGVRFDSTDFIYTRHKKPILDKTRGFNIEFNITHAGNIVLVAFSKNPVGIDIEIEKEINEYLINDLILTKNEINYIKNLPYNEAIKVFFKIWVNKEAYVKAIGKGFYFPINTIEVRFGIEFNQIVDLNNKVKQDFILKDIKDLYAPYSAAIALTDKNTFLRFKDFKV